MYIIIIIAFFCLEILSWRDEWASIIGPNMPILRFRGVFLPAHRKPGPTTGDDGDDRDQGRGPTADDLDMQAAETNQLERRCRGSVGALAKFGNFPFWGLQVDFYKKGKNCKGQKLHRIILLHIGLVTFNFHFPQIPDVFILMILGTSANVHNPQNPLFLNLEPSNYPKHSKKKT